MNRLIANLLAGTVAVAGASPALAVVVNFDGAIDSTGVAFFPLLTHNDYIVANGFYVGAVNTKAGAVAGADLVGAMFDGTDTASSGCGSALVCPGNNATKYIAALNDGLIDVQNTTTATFRASQFDASFIAVPGDAVLASGSMVLQVEGYSATAQLFTQQFTLPGPTAGAYSFGTYALSAANAGTSIVELAFRGFYCSTATTCVRTLDKAQFGLDNIVLTPVPEPSEWLLMGLGLAGLAGLGRRRNARVGA